MSDEVQSNPLDMLLNQLLPTIIKRLKDAEATLHQMGGDVDRLERRCTALEQMVLQQGGGTDKATLENILDRLAALEAAERPAPKKRASKKKAAESMPEVAEPAPAPAAQGAPVKPSLFSVDDIGVDRASIIVKHDVVMTGDLLRYVLSFVQAGVNTIEDLVAKSELPQEVLVDVLSLTPQEQAQIMAVFH
jgi:hypothetical protein